jgi:methionine-rich copper-binding protein CopC
MLRKARSRKWLLAGVLVTSAFGVSSVASAHAPVRGTAPVSNQNLKKAPAVVEVLAGEPGLGTHPDDFISVFDAAGINHASSLMTSAQGDFSRISAPVTSLKSGWYGVHWNVMSEDGHPMGGDDGGWWAFGVNGKTAKAATRSISFSNASKPVGVPASLRSSLNGLRVGSRSLTAPVKWGTITSVKWTVINSSIAQLQGASFSWSVSCTKKSSVCTAKGIIPFVANYRIDVQISAKTQQGRLTSVWSTTATAVG